MCHMHYHWANLLSIYSSIKFHKNPFRLITVNTWSLLDTVCNVNDAFKMPVITNFSMFRGLMTALPQFHFGHWKEHKSVIKTKWEQRFTHHFSYLFTNIMHKAFNIFRFLAVSLKKNSPHSPSKHFVITLQSLIITYQCCLELLWQFMNLCSNHRWVCRL